MFALEFTFYAVGICSFSGTTTAAASNAAISELHPFQVDGLVIFLMMFQNNGACMQTSLAVQTAPLILLLHASYLFSTIGFPWHSYQGTVDCNREEIIQVWERFTRPSIIFDVSLELMDGEKFSSTVFFYYHSLPTSVHCSIFVLARSLTRFLS
ncbi:uncharacterized protein LOC111804533 [Cucurbita pepo subsp. pepo]|uniref:uncharacterized protein LOC111804533 n=1 Tax=Cucurbita pepo subsp. pepo TaxID=3664 RepID=UPI000C9D8108|nr:uncharacterized protein LOC111804533 [Cucurbita pepo subsp. pepo]